MIYLRFIDTQQRIFMYHIVFNADENYIKYCAVLMYSIIKHTDSTKQYPFSQNGGGGVIPNNEYKDKPAK